MHRTTILAAAIGACAVSAASAQTMMQRQRIAEETCVQHVMTQAQNAGYDISEDAITVTPATNPEEGAATVRSTVEVLAEGVTGSGRCDVSVASGLQGYVETANVTFERAG